MLFFPPVKNFQSVYPLRGLIIWLQRNITIKKSCTYPNKCFIFMSYTNKPFWRCSTMSWMMSLSTGATWSSCLGERRTSSSSVLSWSHTQTHTKQVWMSHVQGLGGTDSEVGGGCVRSQDFHLVPSEEPAERWCRQTDRPLIEAPCPSYLLAPEQTEETLKKWVSFYLFFIYEEIKICIHIF